MDLTGSPSLRRDPDALARRLDEAAAREVLFLVDAGFAQTATLERED